MQQKNDFSKGDLKKTIIRLSLPLILAQLVNVLYSVIDRIYIGRMPGVGVTVLAGVGLTFPIITMVSAFAALAGNGGAPLCSIARGEKNEEKAERIMGNSFTMLLFFGVVCTFVGLLIKEPLLWALKASEETFPYANDYLTIYLMGSVFVMISLGLNPFINAQGFTRRGMTTVVIGAAANIILDPIFIYALDMGVKGAALATVIAQGLSAAYTLQFLTGRKCILRLRLSTMKPDFAIIRRILSLGFSNFTMKLTESAVQLVCNLQLSTFGGDMYITAMTVINSVRQVIMMPMHGLSEGMQPVVGYNYGAKRYDRVKESYRFSAVTAFIGAAVMAVLLIVFVDPVIVLFAGVDAQMQKFGAICIVTQCIALPIHSWVATVNMLCAGLGNGKGAFLLATARQGSCMLPILFPLAYLFGAYGLCSVQAGADILSLALGIPIAIYMMKRIKTALKEQNSLAAE